VRNTILSLDGHPFKSTAISEKALFLSRSKQKTLGAFNEATQKTGVLAPAKSIPFNKIKLIRHNERSSVLRLVYITEKDKERKADLGFDDVQIAYAFGQELATATGLNATVEEEDQKKKLLTNAGVLLLVIGFTAFLALSDPAEIQNSRSRKGGILKLIAGTVGPTGVWIVGGLIAAYLAYNLYNRFQNPATVTVWE